MTWPELCEGSFEELWRYDPERLLWESLNAKGSPIIRDG